jgi:tetratricopeptide (TPR) repeat protein
MSTGIEEWTELLDTNPGRDLMGEIRDPSTGYWRIPQDSAWSSAESVSTKVAMDRLYARNGLPADLPLRYVAVLDSGLVHDHPAIRPRIELADEWDGTGEGTEDEIGHGTIVALRLLALTVSAQRQLFAIRFINVKVADRRGVGSPETLIAGMRWLAEYASRHSDRRISANLSIGAYQRTHLGLVTCRGTCRVCTAAVELTSLGVEIYAAAGNTPRVTACPASAAVHGKSSGIRAVMASDYSDSGVGTVSARSEIIMEPMLDLADARDKVSLGQEYTDAKRFEAAGAYRQAATSYAHVLDQGAYALNAFAGLRLGMLLTRINQQAGAIETFRKVAALEDDLFAPLATLQLGFLFFKEGDMTAARDAFGASYSSAFWWIVEVGAYHRAIACMGDRKEWPQAWQAFAQVVELSKMDERLASDTKYLVCGLMSLAKLLIMADDYIQARKYLDQAVAADPNFQFPEARYNLAVVSLRLENPERAVQLYTELADAKPPTRFSAAATRRLQALQEGHKEGRFHPPHIEFLIIEKNPAALVLQVLDSLESTIEYPSEP